MVIFHFHMSSFGQMCSQPFGEAQSHTLFTLLLLPWQVALSRPFAMGRLRQHIAFFQFLWTWTFRNKPELVEMTYTTGKNRGNHYD